jgi:hypothetical protein
MARDRFGGYAPGLWTFAVLLVVAALAVSLIRNGEKTEALADVPA